MPLRCRFRSGTFSTTAAGRFAREAVGHDTPCCHLGFEGNGKARRPVHAGDPGHREGGVEPAGTLPDGPRDGRGRGGGAPGSAELQAPLGPRGLPPVPESEEHPLRGPPPHPARHAAGHPEPGPDQGAESRSIGGHGVHGGEPPRPPALGGVPSGDDVRERREGGPQTSTRTSTGCRLPQSGPSSSRRRERRPPSDQGAVRGAGPPPGPQRASGG